MMKLHDWYYNRVTALETQVSSAERAVKKLAAMEAEANAAARAAAEAAAGLTEDSIPTRSIDSEHGVESTGSEGVPETSDSPSHGHEGDAAAGGRHPRTSHGSTGAGGGHHGGPGFGFVAGAAATHQIGPAKPAVARHSASNPIAAAVAVVAPPSSGVVLTDTLAVSAMSLLEALEAKERADAEEAARKALERPPSPPPVAPKGRWQRHQVRAFCRERDAPCRDGCLGV